MAFVKRYKTLLFFALATLAMVLMILFGLSYNIDFGLNQMENVTYPSARVLEVLSDETVVDDHGIRRGRQDLRVEITSGPHRGRIVNAQNTLFVDAPIYAQPGSRLILFFDYAEGDLSYQARVHTYERATGIYLMVALFLAILVLVSGKSGLRAAFGLIFTFVSILFLLIPAISQGAPPALLTLGLSIVITAVSLIALMGFTRKTWISIAGTLIGIGFYGISYLLISWVLQVNGFNIPEMSVLITIGFMGNIGISELLFCGILIASLGAVMDTAVSVASATAELGVDGASLFRDLFRKSMTVARDCIGSSANTLILAFTGTFFVTLVLFRLNNFDYHMIIHRADIAVEVLRAISASIGMVLCGPATALIGSRIYAAKDTLPSK